MLDLLLAFIIGPMSPGRLLTLGPGTASTPVADDPILWDDNSNILWDDGTFILWDS